MSRSNIVPDLNKFMKGGADVAGVKPAEPKVADKPKDPVANPTTPTTAVATEATALAKALVQAKGDRQDQLLKEYTDEKGGRYSQALAIAIPDLEADVRKKARDGLAERMGRMKPGTLRDYMKDENPEFRRAACLGVAVSEEKSLVPDLIKALEDEEEIVWRGARLALKDLSGKDLGPSPGASLAKRREAAAEWLAWWKTQSK